MASPEAYMRRALDLALLGAGAVSPNPMVGCVIVKGDRVIAEGWHKKFGGPHAEVEAVHALEHPGDVEGADVYVSLEPCAHQGKTPPCADLLAELRPAKVYACNLDPNPLVAGKGMERLREAGIETHVGLLEEEGREINRRFFTHIVEKRPYVILKWAQTLDGFIARKDFDSKWISNRYSRALVHKWRSEEDAILVGTNTAEHDDPQLNVRDWTGRDPLRVALDLNDRLPEGLKLFGGSQPTAVISQFRNPRVEGKVEYVKVKVERHDFIRPMLAALYERKVGSLVVEGGARLISTFQDVGLWDEAQVFLCDASFGEGVEAPRLRGKLHGETRLTGDRLLFFRNEKAG